MSFNRHSLQSERGQPDVSDDAFDKASYTSSLRPHTLGAFVCPSIGTDCEAREGSLMSVPTVTTHSITEPGVYEPISDTERGLMLVFEERFGTQVCVCARSLSLLPSLPPSLARALSPFPPSPPLARALSLLPSLSSSRARALSRAHAISLLTSLPPLARSLGRCLARSLL
jgi:hypothetical protein